MGTPFFGARDTKKGALIFWRTVKNTALVPKCMLIRSSSPLHDAIVVDVEVAALPDDLDWWFACGQEALEIQEEGPEESLGGGASSSLKEDPPCFVADVGYVSMAYSTCFQRRPVSHHHDWIRWRLFRVSFAEVCSAFR